MPVAAFELGAPLCDGIISLVLYALTQIQHSHAVLPVHGRAFACLPMTPSTYCRSHHQQLRRWNGMRHSTHRTPEERTCTSRNRASFPNRGCDGNVQYFVRVFAISLHPAEGLPERFDLSAAASRPPRASGLAESRSTVRLTQEGQNTVRPELRVFYGFRNFVTDVSTYKHL